MTEQEKIELIQRQHKEIKKQHAEIKAMLDKNSKILDAIEQRLLPLKGTNHRIDACFQDIARIHNEEEGIYVRKN